MTTERQHMVRNIVKDLKARAFRAIQAHDFEGEDLPGTDGYFQISSQRWIHPDVQARSGDRLFVYEVETDATLDRPETREKIQVLANAAAKANGMFYLVVPEEIRVSAQHLLREMHIERAEILGIGAAGRG